MNSHSPPGRVSPGQNGNLLLFPEEALTSSHTRLRANDQSAPWQAASEPSALSLARVVAEWRPLCHRLGRRHRVLDTILAAGRPIRLGDHTLVVGFGADRQFHRELLDLPEYRRLVEDELARRFGVDLAIVTRLYPESRRRRGPNQAPA